MVVCVATRASCPITEKPPRHGRGRIPSRQRRSCTWHRGGGLFENGLANGITPAVSSWWRAFFWHVARSGVMSSNAGLVRNGPTWIIPGPLPVCLFFLLDYACVEAGSCLYQPIPNRKTSGLGLGKSLPGSSFLKAPRGMCVLLGSKLPNRRSKPNQKQKLPVARGRCDAAQ